MNSPYTARGPLRDAAMFFGRTHELNEIGSYVRGNQSVSIVGPRKIGKTSLMLQLKRTETLSALQMWQGHLFVYVDCRLLGSSGPDEIFVYLCSEMAAAIRARDTESEVVLKVGASRPTRLAFEAAVRGLNERGLRVVFMLDGLEALALNPQVDISFFNALRSAAGRLRLAFVTASAESLFDLTYFNSSQTLLASPFFNIFAQLFLGLLSEPEARTLIRAPMEAADMVVDQQLEDCIYELAGGHPLALQVACNNAWAGRGDRAGIEQLTAQELKPHFEYDWGHLSTAERQVLRNPTAAVRDASDPAIRSTLRDLTRKCLLVQVTSSYVYPSKAWAEFVLAQTCNSAAGSRIEGRTISAP